MQSQCALNNNATIKVKRVKSFPRRLNNRIFKIIAHNYTHTKYNLTTQLVPTSHISSRPLSWQSTRENSTPKSNNNIQSQWTLNNINSTLKTNALFISGITQEAPASSLYPPSHSYTTLQLTRWCTILLYVLHTLTYYPIFQARSASCQHKYSRLNHTHPSTNHILKPSWTPRRF